MVVMQALWIMCLAASFAFKPDKKNQESGELEPHKFQIKRYRNTINKFENKWSHGPCSPIASHFCNKT
jgi:elongation factor P hydroxylase